MSKTKQADYYEEGYDDGYKDAMEELHAALVAEMDANGPFSCEDLLKFVEDCMPEDE